jgi:hypothetical protein
MMRNPKDGLSGVEFLRALVDWLDNRPEYLNEEKSPLNLITEFKTEIEKRVNE